MEGYAKVAKLMAKYPDFAIFRRFRHLNYQNILYLQAEIIHHEDQLRQLVERDQAHSDRRDFTRDWWSLAYTPGRGAKQQWKKVIYIRKLLGRYNTAVLKQAQLAALDVPNAQDLDFLRVWMERPSMGCFPLRGLDRTAWIETDEKDLMALKARTAPDAFSAWFLHTVMPLFHRVCGVKLKQPDSSELGDGIFTYEESLLVTIVDLLTTAIASILPVLSIVVLFFIHSDLLKMGMITIFSACFSVALALMTSARKIEIFAATSAFAAVNVVFLTSTTAICSGVR